MNRRTLLTTFGTGAVIGLSGCSELRTTADSKTDTEESTESQPATPDPVYRLEATDLQFDLTELRTSTLDQHDRAHVRRNHAVQPTITLQKDGERIDPDLLSDLTLETEGGTRVETTEAGHVPEYAVETGQRLTVRGAVDGEPVRDDIAVQKALPESFLIDGKIVDGKDVRYETSWNTPYRFDSHTTEREEFLATRATLRDEMAAERVLERIDTERIRENWRTLRSHDYTERELKGFMLANVRASVVGTPSEESVLDIGQRDAIAQAVNEEKILRELSFLPYEEVFIGALSNKRAGSDPNTTPYNWLPSKVAYVDGDWYHVSAPDAEVEHVSDFGDMDMVVGAESAFVSVLAEFEKDPDRFSFKKMERVDRVVQSPLTLSGALSGRRTMFTTYSVSWSVLESIRNNTRWRDCLSQMELAVDCGLRKTGNVDLQEDEVPERVTTAFGTDLSDVSLLNTTGRNAMTKEGKKPIFFLEKWQTPERIESEYLS